MIRNDFLVVFEHLFANTVPFQHIHFLLCNIDHIWVDPCGKCEGAAITSFHRASATYSNWKLLTRIMASEGVPRSSVSFISMPRFTTTCEETTAVSPGSSQARLKGITYRTEFRVQNLNTVSLGA